MTIPLWIALLVLAVAGSGWAYTRWQSAVIARRFPPNGAFVDVGGGARLHVAERRPEGPARATVVLLHGASGNQADLMVPLGDRLLARGFRVLAIDRPGHGWSDRPGGREGASSPGRQAALIHDGLKRLGVTDAIVVGHSWSGALAATLALDCRGLVGGLLLLSPVLYPWPTGVAWYYGPAASRWLGPAFTRIFALPLGQLAMRAGIAEVFAPGSTPPGYAERTGVALVLRPRTFENNAADVVHLHGHVTRLAPRLPALDMPVSLVTGDSDAIVPAHAHAERLARDRPGTTLVLLRNRGHSPQWSDPDAVEAAIEDIAGRMSAQRAQPLRPQDAGFDG